MKNIYSQMSDHHLISLLKDNNDKVFEEIYERYFILLYNYAYRKLQLKQESQDIVQDVLVKFWKKRHEIELRTSLDVYLFTAVRNKAFDYFAHQKVEEKHVDSLQVYLENTVCNSDYLARENFLREIIEREISALPPRMELIFRMSREKNMTNKEVAEALDLSIHTVDTQVKRALKILKGRLGPYFLFLFF